MNGMRIILDTTGESNGVDRKEGTVQMVQARWTVRNSVRDLTSGVSIEDIVMIANSNGQTRGAGLSTSKNSDTRRIKHISMYSYMR
jgi:hypothetical protein